MAFKLTRKNDGTWEGNVGATVTVDVISQNPARTVQIAYAGKQDGAPPFQFDIKTGLASLLVVALAVKSGQEVEIVEVDGANTQVLRSFFWSKEDFFDVVQVRGK